MEQILIRNLPPGTKAALRARAKQHRTSIEGEARAILADALKRDPTTLVDLIAMEGGDRGEFEPEKLGLTSRTAEL